uniref:RNA dependent RNA polymerase n=1 Tax=Rhizopus microsporus narnavirus 4 TaxID=3156535 RepID=A0AAT9H867_9VIRU
MRALRHRTRIAGGTYASPVPNAKRVPNQTSSEFPFKDLKDLTDWIAEEIRKGHLSPRLDYGILERTRSNDLSATLLATRRRCVKLQFTAFATAWSSAYGTPRFFGFGTRNYRLIVEFYKFLRRFILEGIDHVSAACHIWRAISLGDNERAVDKAGTLPKRLPLCSSLRLHLSSTLKRALRLPTRHLHEESLRKAVDRWTMLTESPPEDLCRQVYEFTYSIFNRHKSYFNGDSGTASLPVPAVKACVEKSTGQGGTISALYELYEHAKYAGLDKYEGEEIHFPHLQPVDPEDIHDPRAWSHLWQLQAEPERGEMTPLEAFRTARFFTTKLAVDRSNYGPIDLIPDHMRRPKAIPIAIEELGQKVRIATKHPAALAHFSRCMAARLLPVLKRERVFRRILHGDQVHIRGPPVPHKVYSADLTAASDYIEHDLGRAVLRGIADGLNISGPTRVALMKCVGSMEVPNLLATGPETLRTRLGAHMGLGTTWTILCILNHFAASKAGPPSSYAICGDDLVAAWTSKQIEIYEYQLERLGLVPNKSKAYEGSAGVFCELLIAPERNGRDYRSIHLPGLAEITCARGTPDGTTRQALNALLHRSLPRPTRQGILQTLARTRSNMIEGPVNMGGYGGKCNPKKALALLASYLELGPVRYTRERNELLRDQIAQMMCYRLPVPIKNSVAVEDAVVALKCNQRLLDVSLGRPQKAPAPASNKKVKRLAWSRLRLGQSILKRKGFIDTSATHTTGNAPRLPKAGSVFVSLPERKKMLVKMIKESPWVSSKGKARCRSLILKVTERSFNRAVANVLSHVTSSPAAGYIPINEVRAALDMSGRIPVTDQNGTERPSWWERRLTSEK